MAKAIFFDIDGTIVTEGTHMIPESAKTAIQNARENGHLTFINTGRTYFNIEKEIRDLGFDGYICGCGSYIYYKEQLLFSSTIPHADCMDVIQVLRDCEIAAFFEENQAVYLDEQSPVTSSEIVNARAMFGARGITCKSFEDDENLTFDKFLVFFGTRSDRKTFLTYIKDKFTYIDRGKGIGEIIQKDCSKATGIQYIMDKLGIRIEDCYAIGDSSNDISMLEFVPHGIAMGNSSREILPYCEYVTSDIMEDGIYRALKQYGVVTC